MTNVRFDANLQPNPDVLAKRLGEATVLVHLATNSIFELNETGTRVWELVCQGVDPDLIVRALAEEFDVDAPQAAEGLENLITQLRTAGLLAS